MQRNHYSPYLLAVSFFLLIGMIGSDFQLRIPKGFPTPYIPIDNQLSTQRVALGKKLFFDPILSRDTSLSCNSCHKPQFAFTDGQPKSIGKNGERLLRNAPTLSNVAYQDSGLLSDMGVPTLEMQILVPVQEHLEFDFDLRLIAERLKKNPDYVKMCTEAYQSEPTPFVITRALACFERTLLSGDSPYDQYINGDKSVLSADQQLGMDMFFKRLKCAECHNGFNFTNLTAQNNGLYENEYPNDPGRFRVSHKEEDKDKFKVPTLRNISLTAPYMHDGSVKTLIEVIDHYASGGHRHKNKSALIQPFQISTKEKEALVSFLESLADTAFVNNPDFRQ